MNLQMKYPCLFVPVFCFTLLLAACNDQKKQVSNTIILHRDSVPTKEKVNPYARPDLSPMDMSYYPPDYPVLKMNGDDSSVLVARVIYSRPPKKGRIIFGDTEKSVRPYGKEWRLGANEATEIEFFIPVKIAGKEIKNGRYIIYCFPYPNVWTIVLNSNLYTWGLHMDATKDIFRCTIPVQEQNPPVEEFTMVFENAGNGANLVMTWDNVKAVLPISFSK